MEILKGESISPVNPPDNSHRPRCRDFGLTPGVFPPGGFNAITDVDGVLVGHCTLIHGEGELIPGRGPVRTGVTAVLPHPGNTLLAPVEAGCHVFNGAGTSTGLDCLSEFGLIETPILLTNTLSVGTAYDALVRWVTARFIERADRRGWFTPVVGETYDGFLNDIHGLHVRHEHVYAALDSASSGPVAEGAVGAGTGTGTCGFKAGIGTASRVMTLGGEKFTVGALVQSNIPGTLVLDGVPVGRELGVTDKQASPGREGSIIALIATDLPLDSRRLNRLAARGALGMARVGVSGSHGSGDYFIAFSATKRAAPGKSGSVFVREEVLRDESLLSPVFAATAEAVEEAILNSIFKAVTLAGRDGNVREALDLDRTRRIMERYGRNL